MKQEIIYQRIEGFTVFAISLYFYNYLQFNIIIFAIFLFSFDIFMLGYFFNKKIGAYIYNFGHSMSIPLLLVSVALLANNRFAIGVSLVWFAHIGLDRALGYGLKLTSGFGDTHLGKIGRIK